MLVRKKPVDFLFKVVRRGGGAEGYACHIFLVMALKQFRQPCCLAYADQKHSCGKRIKRPGMADFQVFLVEMPCGRELDLADHICRCPSVGLVHRYYYASRIVVDVIRQEGTGFIPACPLQKFPVRNQRRCHFCLLLHFVPVRLRMVYFTGIFSILFWWRPPSKGVSSHASVITSTSSKAMNLAGITSTFALLCLLTSSPISLFQASPARIP